MFLKHVARAYPNQELHLVMDNYATHKKLEVREWLAANPRIHTHFTPTSASWMNLVEVWFGIIERQAIHRGTFRNVRELTSKIRDFINGWNPRAQPFVWTKTAEQILAKADRRKTSRTPSIRQVTATGTLIGASVAASSRTSGYISFLAGSPARDMPQRGAALRFPARVDASAASSSESRKRSRR